MNINLVKANAERLSLRRRKKTRITIRIDDDILEWFRGEGDVAGAGSYQTLINDALREHITNQQEPIEVILRRVVREELTAAK